MKQFRSGGLLLGPTRKRKRLQTKWEWDRTTVYVLLIALGFIAFVVYETMRSRRPLEHGDASREEVFSPNTPSGGAAQFTKREIYQ